MYSAKAGGRNKVCVSYPNKIPFLVEWNTVFESGNIEIDKQHKELVEQLNSLIQNYYGNFNKKEFLSIFNKIIDSSIAHFVTEESILTNLNYLDLEEHKLTHERLINEVLEIKEKLNNKEVDPTVINKFLLNNLIIGHIVSDDISYFKYLNNRENH